MPVLVPMVVTDNMSLFAWLLGQVTCQTNNFDDFVGENIVDRLAIESHEVICPAIPLAGID